MEKLIIESELELRVLHRAIFEAKFSIDPEDSDLAGSPILSNLAERIVALLEHHDARWTDWRNSSNHPKRVKAAICLMKQWNQWPELNESQQLEAVHDFLSPLVCTRKEALKIIDEVNS